MQATNIALPQGPSLRSRLCCPGPSSLNRPHPSHSQAHRDFAAQRFIRDAFAVREHLGDPRLVPGFRRPFFPDMPSSTTPESSTSSVPGSDVNIGLRQRSSGSALSKFPQSVSRGGKISGLHSSHICYGLSVCSAPCTDLTGLPANGAFYVQAFNGSVALPVVGYDYNIDWTPMLVGLAPTRMAASLAARSSPSRCGPGQSIAAGQTRDLPASSAFLLHVMYSSTPAGWRRLALTALHMLRSTFCTVSAPAAY
jgi:hypothetical protein